MKFTVTKNDITEAVSNIQRAVSSKTSIPALECILLTAADGKLELCAYDLELGMTTTIPAKVEEEGKAALTAKIFSDIVRKTPDDTVTVTVDDNNIISVTVKGDNETPGYGADVLDILADQIKANGANIDGDSRASFTSAAAKAAAKQALDKAKR